MFEYMANMGFHCTDRLWSSFLLWNSRTVMWIIIKKNVTRATINIVVSIKLYFNSKFKKTDTSVRALAEQLELIHLALLSL